MLLLELKAEERDRFLQLRKEQIVKQILSQLTKGKP
jgi:hypothetical protein